jgi:hypothetical protein
MEERIKRVLSVHEQYAYMRRICPDFNCKVQNGRLECKGSLQPFPFTKKYKVRITYRVGEFPKVHVESPALRSRHPNEPIPHTYEGSRPCLFLPSDQSEWSAEKILAETIVPWLALWLFYYETWLSTGKWQGGGEHPVADKKDKKKSVIEEKPAEQDFDYTLAKNRFFEGI